MFFIVIGCVPNQIEKTDCQCEEKVENKKAEECNIIEVKEKSDDVVVPFSQLKQSEWYELSLIHI